MIEAKNLRFSYKDAEILKNINLKIEKGSFVAIIGANGSGKSTLAKHMNALLLPSDGAMYVKGIDTRDESRLFEVRSAVGMVFQNPDNQTVASVVENEVAFAPENLGMERDEIRRRVNDALTAVGLTEYANELVSALSGGQKQLLAVAAALAMRSGCVVFDEATSMLDPSGRAEVLNTVFELKSRNITVVLITHYMDEAAKADRIIVMDNGRIVMDGAPKEVFARAEQLIEIGLELPQTAKLAYELRKSGVDIEITLDEEELIGAVAKVLEARRND